MMQYLIKKENISTSHEITSTLMLEGYLLPSKSHQFLIEGEKITNINLISKKFAYPFISKLVFKKYDKLIKKITDLFVSEEEEGTAMSEVLNEIERFKEEIKKNYRKYLKKKELEEMAVHLKFLQEEAKKKQFFIYYNYTKTAEKESHRTR